MGQLWVLVIKPLVTIVLYFLLGIVVYMSFEEHEVACNSSHSSTETCYEKWSFIDAFYFSMVTMSTVGYGTFLAPGTDGTKLFTCIYIIIGVGLVFPIMANFFQKVLDALDAWIMLGFHELRILICGKRAEVGVDVDGDGEVDIPDPPSALKHYGKGLCIPVISMFLIVMFLSAYIFTLLEKKCTYWEGVYHCWITSTTVGYGDTAIENQSGRLWATIHIFLSTSWLLAIIGRLGKLYNVRKNELQRMEIMKRPLDLELIKGLDRDGDGGGVDKIEFVLSMLITHGVELCGTPLSWDDVEPFASKFDALDTDGSGVLTGADLEKMVELEREKRSRKRRSRTEGPTTPVHTPTTEVAKPVDTAADDTTNEVP